MLPELLTGVTCPLATSGWMHKPAKNEEILSLDQVQTLRQGDYFPKEIMSVSWTWFILG